MSEALKPIVDQDNEQFWNDCRQHVLSLQRCKECQRYRYPPRLVCPHCLSENAEWETVSGKGTVYSFVTVHHTARPDLKDDVPYNLSLIELREGPRMWSRVVGCAPNEVRIGMPVEVEYVERDGATLPFFHPSQES